MIQDEKRGAGLPEMTIMEEVAVAEAPDSEIKSDTVLQAPGETRLDNMGKKGEEATETASEIFEGEPVYFDFDKSLIKSEYRPVLEGKAKFLRANPHARVRIEGNCDERGTSEYNLALGEGRANSAKQFLVALGISPDRIETLSYGEEKPLASGHNEKAWAQNRRDDFSIIRR